MNAPNQPPTMNAELIVNKLLSRSDLLTQLLDGANRDIDSECGYPKDVTPALYRRMYDREGIASRVVSIFPEECWAETPTLYETEDPEETEFEKEWNSLNKKFHIWSYLERIDELSGIGSFGILLLGLSDGGELHEPVEGMPEEGDKELTQSVADLKLLYIRPFDRSCVEISQLEERTSNPRFGEPVLYEITFDDGKKRSVHWTRVIHIADNRKVSEVEGTPRMQTSYNRLYDLRKILSGSGEMFWKGAFPGYAFEVGNDGEVEFGDDEKKAMREEFEKFANSLQRYMAVKGVTAKSLAPQVASPEDHFITQIKAICIISGIPYRVFMGSEAAKLASEQDAKAWNGRKRKRQLQYLTPFVISPFVLRLMAYGILPWVDEHVVDWPDMNAATDQEKAEVLSKIVEALAKYVGGNVAQLIPELEFLTMFMNLPQEQADAILDAARERIEDLEVPEEDDELFEEE